MKRIISLILILSIASCGWPIFTYAEELEKYLTIPVEYSDNIGNSEQLEIMVKDGCVYANAEMLAERLGYSLGKEEECIVIYNTENEDIFYFAFIFHAGSVLMGQVFIAIVFGLEAVRRLNKDF